MWRHFGSSNEFHWSSFCIAAPIEYIYNESRLLDQLCGAFRETWGHFLDAGGLPPEFLKSAYFGGLVPPLYR